MQVPPGGGGEVRAKESPANPGDEDVKMEGVVEEGGDRDQGLQNC